MRTQLFDLLSYLEIVNHSIFVPLGFKCSIWLVEIKTEFSENYFDWHQSQESSEFFLKTEMTESQYKLDLNYLMRKPSSFNNFINYVKRAQLFNKMSEFKLALILQSVDKNGNTADVLIKQTNKDASPKSVTRIAPKSPKFSGISEVSF